MTIAKAFLTPGRVKPVWAGHPWVYAQAVARVEGEPEPGDVIEAVDPQGRFLGRGFWSPDSAIPLRIVTRTEDEQLDEEALGRRIDLAAVRRERVCGLPSTATDGFRLVNAEGDGLPGLVVDRFGPDLVVQIGTVGMWTRREAVFDRLAALPGVETVMLVAGGDATRREGIDVEAGTVRGAAVDRLRFRERGLEWELPSALGQKTGFYFDQRENRERVEALATGRRVLDAYAYVGAFALAAARGGATEVLALDRSERALETGRAVAAANELEVRFERADVKRDLARRADAGERWDLIVLDPPKLVPTTRHLAKGERAYRAINVVGLRLASPGGVVVSCSCSAAMTSDRLLRVIAEASSRVGRDVRVLEVHGQGQDHPTPPAFGEGRYLTCVILEVD